MRDKTQIELEEMRKNAIESFQMFTEKMNNNMENIKEAL